MTRLDVELYTMTAVGGRALQLSGGREIRLFHACGAVLLEADQSTFVLSLEAFHAFRALAEEAVRTRVVPELEDK